VGLASGRVTPPREWLEKAEVFLAGAERHLEEEVYWLACFEA